MALSITPAVVEIVAGKFHVQFTVTGYETAKYQYSVPTQRVSRDCTVDVTIDPAGMTPVVLDIAQTQHYVDDIGMEGVSSAVVDTPL